MESVKKGFEGFVVGVVGLAAGLVVFVETVGLAVGLVVVEDAELVIVAAIGLVAIGLVEVEGP